MFHFSYLMIFIISFFTLNLSHASDLQLSLRYHIEAAAFYTVGSEQYKFIGFGACNHLYKHVQSLNGHAPQNIKELLARMYDAYLQKYPEYDTPENREKIQKLTLPKK